jgi:CheY-like chemotaxis protein
VRILFVDDELALLEALERALMDVVDDHVELADSGASALALLAREPSTSSSPTFCREVARGANVCLTLPTSSGSHPSMRTTIAALALLAACETTEEHRARTQKEAERDVGEIVEIVRRYMAEMGKCPDMPDLVAAGLESRLRFDPWGGEYEVVCPAGPPFTVEVRSWGHDRTAVTADDVRRTLPE